MVLSLDSKLGYKSYDYAQFVSLCGASNFQAFINRTSLSLAIYDFRTKKCEFVSDAMLGILVFEKGADQIFRFNLLDVLEETSSHMIIDELEPLILRNCDLYSNTESKLCFSANVQFKNKSWKLLQNFPLSVPGPKSFLMCSIISDIPTGIDDLLQCWASVIGQDGDEKLNIIKPVTTQPSIKGVSKREMQVLRLLCKGRTSKEISEQLFVSFETVKKHRQNILEKTGCKNTVELMNLAMSMGVI